MPATSLSVTWRGLGAKTKPTASAPASRARTRVVVGSVAADLDPEAHRASTDTGQEIGKSRAGIGLAHEAFADEERVVAREPEAGYFFAAGETAFCNAHHAGWDAVDEVEGCVEIDFEGAQVAIVDADGVGAGGSENVEEAVQLRGGVDFDEDIERKSACGGGEGAQIGVGQCGDDEEDGIGVMGAGFDELILVDHEVFAQARDLDSGGGAIEIGEAALKVRLVGEDGESGGSAGLKARSEPGRIEGFADESFGGRGFFDFRNDGGGFRRFAAKSGGPTTGSMRGGEALKLRDRHTRACRGHSGAGGGEDCVEAGAHTLQRV